MGSSPRINAPATKLWVLPNERYRFACRGLHPKKEGGASWLNAASCFTCNFQSWPVASMQLSTVEIHYSIKIYMAHHSVNAGAACPLVQEPYSRNFSNSPDLRWGVAIEPDTNNQPVQTRGPTTSPSRHVQPCMLGMRAAYILSHVHGFSLGITCGTRSSA